MKKIKNPLVANIDRSNGEIEISIAKKYSEAEEPVFQEFMGMCAMYDNYAVNTAEEDDSGTEKACSSVFNQKMNTVFSKMEANIFSQKKHMLAGLSEDEKKNLPIELQKAFVKKLKKEGKITKETDATLFNPKGGTIANFFAPEGA